jgi:CheY-like chemotaxis protein
MPKRIFIVDDSTVIRQFLRTHLQNTLKNSICSEAADGLDAVERVAELAPDLIVLDFCMPRMNGLEAAGIIHGMLPEVPIILYTLHTEIVPEMVAKAAGICAVVSKTDPMDVLLGEIQSMAGIGRAASA